MAVHVQCQPGPGSALHLLPDRKRCSVVSETGLAFKLSVFIYFTNYLEQTLRVDFSVSVRQREFKHDKGCLYHCGAAA